MLVQLSHELRKRNGLTLSDDRKMAWTWTNNLLNDSNQANQRILMCVYMCILYIYIYTQTIYTSYYFHIGIPFSKHITRKSMQTWNNFCSFAHSSNQIHVLKTVPMVLPALPCCTNRLIPKRQMKMSWWFETYWPNWIISPRKGVKIPKKCLSCCHLENWLIWIGLWGHQYLQTGREPQISPHKK